jgi:uncharacterized protein YaeQ
MEYRLALSHVERGVTVEETLITALHPSETREHLTLRVLAHCLLHRPGLTFGPGLSTPDAPDLWAHDLTGRVTAWIECGAASGETLRKALAHHAGAEVHVVLDEPRRKDELVHELAGWKRAAEIEVWLIDRALVSRLAAPEERRRRWTVTIVGDHLYVDEAGATVDGAVERGAAWTT